MAQHIDLRDYIPLPMQKAFHESKAKYRAFIGGFGSGKTMALCYEALMLGIEYPGNRILIGRKTYPELEGTTKMEFMNIVPPELIKKFQDTKNVLELVNGTLYFFRALDKLDKIKSLNLGAVAIDEMSEIDEGMFHMLQSRLRYAKIKRRCLIGSTNAEGHNWVWRVFVNKEVKPAAHDDAEMRDIDNRPELFEHFVSPTTDNHHLPPDYIEDLKASYSPAWIRRYIYSSFDEFEGLIFYAFEPSKNLTKEVKVVVDR